MTAVYHPRTEPAVYHPSDGAPLVLEPLLDEECTVAHRDTRHHRLLLSLGRGLGLGPGFGFGFGFG